MRRLARLCSVLLLCICGATLAGCGTAEERAERHYQRGVALLAEGDVDRALIEFRNVFRLNGDHTRARLQYARLLRDRGEIAEAFAQYLRAVEQDPDDLESRRELTELALTVHDFETAAIHAERAFAIDPADPATRALKATVDYRAGNLDAASAMAEGVLAEAPDSVPAHVILIADRINAGDLTGALARIETALAAVPDDEGLHLLRLAALEQNGNAAGVGAQLERMAELFPANDGIREAQFQHYLRDGDLAAAEATLRARAALAPDDPTSALDVARFLLEAEGPSAARAEIERLIAAAADPLPFQRALAEFAYSTGAPDEAIAILRTLINGAASSDATRDLQVTLATILEAEGAADDSAALVAEVLEGDPAHVEALKLRAMRLIAADEPDRAIQDMRSALTQAPNDPEVLTIMAQAHERDGARELARERLALAVENSRQAPAESLRYARFLDGDGRLDLAESVVVDALRRAPNHTELLAALGEIHLGRRDWARARQVSDLLRVKAEPAAARAATTLEAAALRGQGRLDEAVAVLRRDAANGGGLGQDGIVADVVRLHLEAGDAAAAQAALDEALARDPRNFGWRMMRADLRLLQGDAAGAEALYRALVASDPTHPATHGALAALLAGAGRTEEASAAIDAGLAAAPEDPGLLTAKAASLEAAGEFEKAIAVYETLYARNSANPVIANNLASLLTAHRDDPESLGRAFAMARRLRASNVPQFQDTYGWILSRRGDPEQALGYLEPAAQALPDNALVQFHLGRAYLDLGRLEAARSAFVKALDADADDSALPQITEARDLLVEIDGAASATTPPDAPAEDAGN